jgi:phage-related minor tail protein
MHLNTLTVADLENLAVRRRVEAYLRLCTLAEDPTRGKRRGQYIQQALGTLQRLFRSTTTSVERFTQSIMGEVRRRFAALLEAASGVKGDFSWATVGWTMLY